MGCLSMDGQPIFLFFGKLGFGWSKRNGFFPRNLCSERLFLQGFYYFWALKT